MDQLPVEILASIIEKVYSNINDTEKTIDNPSICFAIANANTHKTPV